MDLIPILEEAAEEEIKTVLAMEALAGALAAVAAHSMELLEMAEL